MRPDPAGTPADVDKYMALLAPLYHAIRPRAAADVIVDNSKQPEVALIARTHTRGRSRVLHLVRRSHGVAYSWTKHVSRSDNPGEEMLRERPGERRCGWTADNALFETAGPDGLPRLTIRYEDFVADAARRTRRLAAFLGSRP